MADIDAARWPAETFGTTASRKQDVPTSPRGLRSAIIGAGFIGTVHARAVRAAGGVLAAAVDVSTEGARRLGAERASAYIDDVINAKDIDIVHVCTPNHLHADIAMRAIAAGKHVICEKPLATDDATARMLMDAARAAMIVAAVPFVYRFYPTVREARHRVTSGGIGNVQLVHGSYLQDWLARSDATNWRVDARMGGASRAFADIGVHWCDLMEFATGQRIRRVSAKLRTVHHNRPGAQAGGAQTEDAATLMFETDDALGSLVLSQVSPGRKNRLWLCVEGTTAALAFDQETPEALWVGTEAGSALNVRATALTSPAAQRYDVLPAGHPQGYQDCFNAFVADVYAAAHGLSPDGLPTFADGYRAAMLTHAVLQSAQSEKWIEVAP